LSSNEEAIEAKAEEAKEAEAALLVVSSKEERDA
jgi:hypothetical protein